VIDAGRIRLIRGDITTLEVDAIVNAANSSLLGGGGVDGAIHRTAGPALLEECRTLGGCPPGEARVTGGYRLPARWVIHTVGPIWHGGTDNEDATLAACYRSSLDLAVEVGARTVAFPSISTGVYGFPIPRAAPIALAAIRDALERHADIEAVTLVCFNDENYEAYAELLEAGESGEAS
jgi:O-acetyl-ADP-ribose deacetylase (regulator of RNase III)